jgi:hypothetical protein
VTGSELSHITGPLAAIGSAYLAVSGMLTSAPLETRCWSYGLLGRCCERIQAVYLETS